ncbi:MAG: hypothetical protein B7Z37_31040 [Verrucomicrobia bacterium 12-59-8]|nr:MAG: hypothetical protein B7Z37_31040 [Verrucomicrobia bacterium 12-59-8]
MSTTRPILFISVLVPGLLVLLVLRIGRFKHGLFVRHQAGTVTAQQIGVLHEESARNSKVLHENTVMLTQQNAKLFQALHDLPLTFSKQPREDAKGGEYTRMTPPIWISPVQCSLPGSSTRPKPRH